MQEENSKNQEITLDYVGKFLEGHDNEERIVNLEYSYKDNFIKVYYRNENDDKCVREEPFYPFLWATRDACLKLCNGNRQEVKRLLTKHSISIEKLQTEAEGVEPCDELKHGYEFLFKSLVPSSYSDFLDFFKEANNPVYGKSKKDDNSSFTYVPRSKNEDRQYLCVTPAEQYLISTGKRFFKGYDDYDQALRMIFDLETTGLDTEHDRIEQIGIRFNRPVKYKGEYINFEKIYTVTGKTEEEKNASEIIGIDTFLKIIYTFHPDIITAHNGENFDWNMIIGACKRLGTSIEEMSSKYFNGKSICKSTKESILKLGGEIETFNQTIVPGIIVTDSLHAVRRAQATDSNFLKADLKYSTKYLKLKKDNRVYVPGNQISTIWNDFSETYAFNNTDGDWYKYDQTCQNGETDTFKKGKTDDKSFVMYTRNYIADGYVLKSGRYIVERYLLDDLWECDKVEATLNGTDFMLCKIVPVTYQKCCTMGTAGQWKMIMLAWSYENGLAIPLAENTGSFTGGLSRLIKTGYVDNCIKLDYNSLYPSIILTWGISDKTDLKGAMLHMLTYVLTTREKYKGLKKKAGKIVDAFKERVNNGEILSESEMKEYELAQKDYKINDNRQLVVKKLGNSFFGSYGSNNGAIFPWKSVNCAERTTCTGRQSLRLMISHFQHIDYQPIVGDSFTGDTPLFIKYKGTGFIDIKPISELIDEQSINIDELGREYDYSKKDYYVLCRSGWVEPSYIYRHATNKPIYEVIDGKSRIEVTEDHSLFNDKQEKIKPSEITKDTKLEYYKKALEYKKCNVTFSDDMVVVLAKQLANGVIDRVPLQILNANKQKKKLFYSYFTMNQKDNVIYSKTCIAGIQFLIK